ncbi:MAG TPA: TetR/AcrR family transcriptional regulator [Candidatus Yaniella excrementigallinarum]|nr:TetR/AcrR family transcriptional regulator [Candidatus Yaniella excrementigallinarum]
MAFTEDSTLGRREQKKLETRRAIRNAALELGTQRGVERLTVESIAHAAGISPRTFFNYFSSKEDALVADATEAASQICALLLERPAEEAPMRALHNAVMDSPYLGSIQPNRERTLARQRLAQHDPSLMKHQLGKIAQLEHMFADALATRMGVEVDEDIFPELLAAMAVSMIRVAIRRWVANEEQPLYELIDTAFQQCQRLDAYNAHVLPAS